MFQPIGNAQLRWTFQPSPDARALVLPRLKARLRRHAFPNHALIKAPTPHARHVVMFMFSPTGRLSWSRRLALQRYHDMNLPVHLVMASNDPSNIPSDVVRQCNGVHWKGLAGYDFSGYTLGLWDLAEHAPGGRALLVNDAMFGPFFDVRPLIDQAPWDLTGFTAHDAFENHLQSFSLVMGEVTAERLQLLSSVFSREWAYSWNEYVIWQQEMRLAKVAAAQGMSAGAWVHYDKARCGDMSLMNPIELVNAGFPYLKKSLLGKMSVLHDVEDIASFVGAHGFLSDSTRWLEASRASRPLPHARTTPHPSQESPPSVVAQALTDRLRATTNTVQRMPVL